MFYRRDESHKSSALNVPDFMIAIFLLEVDIIEKQFSDYSERIINGNE